MRSAAVFLGGVALVLVHTGNYWNATWVCKWFFLISLVLGGFSIGVARKTSWFHLPLMLYAFGSMLILGLWLNNPYGTVLDLTTVMAIQRNALSGILELTACLTLFALLRRGAEKGAVYFMALLWLASVCVTLLQPFEGFYSAPNHGGWFGNPSMGMSLVACLLPFAWQVLGTYRHTRKLKWLFIPLTWGFTLWAAWRTRASIPWGVLGVTTAAYCVAGKPLLSWFWRGLGIAALAVAMIVLGNNLMPHDFWDHNNRLEIWSMMWHWFWEHAYPSIGFGYSSLFTITPIIQILKNVHAETYFVWLHNDWLQLALEGGYVGMVCVFLSVGHLVATAYKRAPLFAALAGFMTMGLFNYPLRMPIHCFCLILICALIEAEKTPTLTLTEWVARGHSKG